MWAGLPITSNPWTGGERRVVAAIRERIDASTIVIPDGPPLNGRDLAAFRAHLADGVEAAYAAVYRTDHPVPVVVYGLRFASDSSFEDAWVKAAGRPGTRFASGRTIVELSGDSSPCFPAVAAYVRTLLNR
jgi:hypothetical protein